MIKIYLDNCCFNRPFDDQSNETVSLETRAKLNIQEKVKSKLISLVWSFMLDYENSANPSDIKINKIQEWAYLSNFYINPDDSIYEIAFRLNKIGLKQKDSIHLACAIFGECEIFITVDKGILKKANLIREIKIFNPIEFLYFYEENV